VSHVQGRYNRPTQDEEREGYNTVRMLIDNCSLSIGAFLSLGVNLNCMKSGNVGVSRAIVLNSPIG
jgi:hypothetical protein